MAVIGLNPADPEIAAALFKAHLDKLWEAAWIGRRGWQRKDFDSLHSVVALPAARASGDSGYLLHPSRSRILRFGTSRCELRLRRRLYHRATSLKILSPVRSPSLLVRPASSLPVPCSSTSGSTGVLLHVGRLLPLRSFADGYAALEERHSHRRCDSDPLGRGSSATLLPKAIVDMIVIPDSVWDSMLDEFAREMRAVEQVVYLDGVRYAVLPSVGVVTTLTIPDAHLEDGRFEVSSESMSQAGKHLRQFQLKRLAQVHTHPEAWVGHSPWDDLKAYSSAPGSMSIVLPDYARFRPTLNDAGVHLRTETKWRQLVASEVSHYVRVVPGFLDFRITQDHERDTIQPTRGRPWWKALAFWRS